MIIDELKKLTPLGADNEDEQDEWDDHTEAEDEELDPLAPDDTDDPEDFDPVYEEDDDEEWEGVPGDETGTIIRDVAEYDLKIDLLRAYVGYYTESDLELMFDTVSLIDVLTKYSYSQIRARLVNTKSNTLEQDFDIGDIVEINKPVLRYNIYVHDEGMIIGKHLIFDDKDKNRSPIYHTVYDILVQSEQFIDGFSYEIKRERASDLILKENTIEKVKDIMNEFASYQIERNV